MDLVGIAGDGARCDAGLLLAFCLQPLPDRKTHNMGAIDVTMLLMKPMVETCGPVRTPGSRWIAAGARSEGKNRTARWALD